jgi:hypothetical protein
VSCPFRLGGTDLERPVPPPAASVRDEDVVLHSGDAGGGPGGIDRVVVVGPGADRSAECDRPVGAFDLDALGVRERNAVGASVAIDIAEGCLANRLSSAYVRSGGSAMADDVWARPRIPTGESVAATLRLAKELKPDACVLYDGDDGATELIVRRGGKVSRHVLYASGATEQTEVREPLPRYRLSRKLIYAGLICLPLIVGAGFVFKPENSDLWIGGPFMIAMALIGAAGLVQQHHDLDALAPVGAAVARIPHDLGGWEPKTAAQLRAVCDLCKAGDGNAYVLERSDGGVEVETIHKHERHRHLLDVRGVVVEHDVAADDRQTTAPVGRSDRLRAGRRT